MPRWGKFLLSVLLGLIIGLMYGWLVDPVEIINTTPEMLGQDFQTDIVLMISELYAATLDLDSATHALSNLFPQSPQNTLSEAISYAKDVGYAPLDIVSLQYLAAALQASLPGVFP